MTRPLHRRQRAGRQRCAERIGERDERNRAGFVGEFVVAFAVGGVRRAILRAQIFEPRDAFGAALRGQTAGGGRCREEIGEHRARIAGESDVGHDRPADLRGVGRRVDELRAVGQFRRALGREREECARTDHRDAVGIGDQRALLRRTVRDSARRRPDTAVR